jgi:UDP-glucuronate decarboxylase
MEKGIVGPVNIGNPEGITIIEVANKIIDLTNSKTKIEFYSLP